MFDYSKMIQRAVQFFPTWSDIRKRYKTSTGGKLIGSILEETCELEDAIKEYSGLNKLVDYVKTLQDDIYSYPVIIGHTDNMKLANMLKDLLVNEFGEKLNIEIVDVNPTAGSHCGPDCIGVSFHAVRR